MSRISTYSLNTALSGNALKAQNELAQAQIQQSSGLVADSYGALGNSTSRILSLADELNRTQSRTETISVAISRVEAMYTAVGDMASLMTSLRGTISGALNGSQDTILTETADGMLADLSDLMNLKVEGRYLFSGNRTDTAPVDLTSFTDPVAADSKDTSYYKGDNALMALQLSEESSLSYGVTANNTAFEKALRAVRLVSDLTTDPIDNAGLQAAYELASEALNGLTAVQSNLSIKADRMETSQQGQENFITLVQAVVDSEKNVDVAEVALAVSQYETLLEASYLATSKLQNLSLAKYL